MPIKVIRLRRAARPRRRRAFALIGPQTTTLAAATGTYALTGEAATFRVQVPVAAGSFALSGIAAPLQVGVAAASGAFALTGEAATFATSLSESNIMRSH